MCSFNTILKGFMHQALIKPIWWASFPTLITNQEKFKHTFRKLCRGMLWSAKATSSSICDFDDNHDDVIKRKHLPRYWPFVREIHRSPVNSPHKGQWHRTLLFSLICAWINGWVNNRVAVIWDAITPIMTSQWCPALFMLLSPGMTFRYLKRLWRYELFTVTSREHHGFSHNWQLDLKACTTGHHWTPLAKGQ